MVGTSTCCQLLLLRAFYIFSDRFLPLRVISLLLQFLDFVLIEGISVCLWFSGTQLHFEDASCTFQGCFWFPGWVPRLADISWQYFNRHSLPSAFLPFDPCHLCDCS